MTDNQLANELTVFEVLTKPFAAALAFLYLIGFLVAASYLSRYGVSSFAMLHLQYLVAGVWALGPLVLYASLLHTEQQFAEKSEPVKVEFGWRRLAISHLVSKIPSGVLLALLMGSIINDLNWGTWIRLLLYFFAMVICAQLFWISRRVDGERETWWMNRSHAAPFYLKSLLMIVLCYALWFSVRIYPLIPFSLGGGKPLTVAFIEGERKMPDEIQKADRSAKRSIPYKLLLATDKSFVVVSPSDKERSVEISRDSVAGMVVLAAN